MYVGLNVVLVLGSVLDWKVQQLQPFILLYRRNSEIKRTTQDGERSRHSSKQKQQLAV